MWKHSKLLKLFNNSSTAYGHTKETKKSLILVLYSVYVTLFYKSNSEIPVLPMTCRVCNIIQLSNFALYLSTERNYISMNML